MHIVLVTYEFPPAMAIGGISSYMLHIAKLLYRSGYTVSVISATRDGEFSVVERGFCTNFLLPASSLSGFRQQALAVFEQYFNPEMVDVIESPEVGACALEIKRQYPQIPLLVKLHTPGVVISKVSNSYQSVFTKLRYVAGAFRRGRFDLGYWNRKDLNKERDPEYQICVLADRLLSPSKALKKWAIHFWGLPSEKIRLIPNPFTLNDALIAAPLSGRTKTICFVGKLTVLKGMYAFTPALRRLLKRYPDYRAVLAGRDEPISPTQTSMQTWMQDQLGSVADRVEFAGVLTADEVQQLVEKSTIAVVPSLWENYPNVLLEAMGAGCAVAAANRGGIPEIITHEQNGLLFNPKSSRNIFRVLNRLLTNEKYRLELAAAGRKRVEELNSASIQELITTEYKELNSDKK
jgi:glycosyltransferase involved in cell wall biosynthesis